MSIESGGFGDQADALVLGGTGMIAGASSEMSRHDMRVWTPSRRGPAPLGCHWFEFDWRLPMALSADLQSRIRGKLAVLLVWVHYPYRIQIWNIVDNFVSDDTAIIDIWSHAGARPEEARHLRSAPPHSHIILGRGGPRRDRWLSDVEISDGAIAAVMKARLKESTPKLTVIGSIDPSEEMTLRSNLSLDG